MHKFNLKIRLFLNGISSHASIAYQTIHVYYCSRFLTYVLWPVLEILDVKYLIQGVRFNHCLRSIIHDSTLAEHAYLLIYKLVELDHLRSSLYIIRQPRCQNSGHCLKDAGAHDTDMANLCKKGCSILVLLALSQHYRV